MSETVTRSIKCDACGEELITNTQSTHSWLLKLSCIENNKNTSETAYSIYYLNPMPEDKHFCDIKCLRKWLKSWLR